MTFTLLDGKKLSSELEINLKKKFEKLEKASKLSIILVGDNPASSTYVNMKKKACERMGVNCDIHTFKDSISQDEVLREIFALNNDSSVIGILVQLPLPKNFSTRKILDSVAVKKDVDGLHSQNMIKILLSEEEIVPATPKGVIRLLEEFNISIEGKNICFVGFGNLVGKPLTMMCVNRGATVSVCHVKTHDITKYTKIADIVISATGVPGLIKENMVKEGVVVVDAGISKKNGKILGDVDFENVKNKCSHITPVPGGVGPMTITMLLENLLEVALK